MNAASVTEPFRFSVDTGSGGFPHPSAAAPADALARDTRVEIQRLVQEIRSLCRSRIAGERFWPRFISLVGSALASDAIILWQRSDAHWVRAAHCGALDPRLLPTDPRPPTDRPALTCHDRLIHEVGESAGPVIVPPGADWYSVEPGNPTDLLAAVVPVPVDPDEPVQWMLELFLPPGGGPATQRGYLRFIADMADLAAEHLRWERFREYRQRTAWSLRLQAHLAELYHPQPLSVVQQRVVDAVAELMAAERVALVRCQRGRLQVVAVSGVDAIDPHAAAVAELRQCAAEVESPVGFTSAVSLESADPPDTGGRPVFKLPRLDGLRHSPPGRVEPQARREAGARGPSPLVPRDPPIKDGRVTRDGTNHKPDDLTDVGPSPTEFAPELPPQAKPPQAKPPQANSPEAGPTQVPPPGLVLRGVAVLDSAAQWRLVVEDRQEAEPPAASEARWPMLVRHLELALLLAQRSSSSRRNPLGWSRVEAGGRSSAASVPAGPGRKLLVAGGVLAVFAVAALLPFPLVVTADGRLEPRDVETIYAPHDGTVAQIWAVHGSPVQAGDPLVRLVDIELDRTVNGLVARRMALVEEVQGLERRLARDGSRDRLEAERLQGEIKLVQEQLAGVDGELEILRAQQASMLVRAGRDGTVDAWQARERLEHRPVQRGQAMMRVIDPRGSWEIEAEIPQTRLGSVVAARDSGRVDADVVATAFPEIALKGRLLELGPVAPPSAGAEPTGSARFSIESGPLPIRQPGAPVRIAIDCGTRSLGYVACQDLLRMLEANIRLYW